MRAPGMRGGATALRQWTQLPVRAKVAVVETSLVIIAIECTMRFVPIDMIARRVRAPLADGSRTSMQGDTEVGVSRYPDRTQLRLGAADWTLARWMFDATCLRKALLYGWVLRDRAPQLHIGLMKDGDAVAHA